MNSTNFLPSTFLSYYDDVANITNDDYLLNGTNNYPTNGTLIGKHFCISFNTC